MKRITNPVFVVFEGLDGAGKSTCARRTAEMLDGCYLHTPSGPLRDHREAILASFHGNPEAAELMYLASVAHASGDVKSRLSAGQSVVLDRYLLSTQVYAEFRGSALKLDDAISQVLLPADLTVFLHAPQAVRRSRLRARSGEIGADDEQTLSEFADLSLREGYRRRLEQAVAGRVLVLDSTQLDVDEIAIAVTIELRRLQGESK